MINQGVWSFAPKQQGDFRHRKSPCSSSLYKRMHCLPSAPFGNAPCVLIVELTTLSKSPVKGWKMLHFTGSFRQMTQKLDCAHQNPTASSLLILSRFSSMEEWTYRSSVMVVLECPSTSESDLISKPTSTARVANV